MSWRTSGRRVTIPEPRGRKSRPTILWKDQVCVCIHTTNARLQDTRFPCGLTPDLYRVSREDGMGGKGVPRRAGAYPVLLLTVPFNFWLGPMRSKGLTEVGEGLLEPVYQRYQVSVHFCVVFLVVVVGVVVVECQGQRSASQWQGVSYVSAALGHPCLPRAELRRSTFSPSSTALDYVSLAADLG